MSARNLTALTGIVDAAGAFARRQVELARSTHHGQDVSESMALLLAAAALRAAGEPLLADLCEAVRAALVTPLPIETRDE
jgi:hypothetical protein